MDLHRAVKELEFLCLERDWAGEETDQDQLDDSAMHAAPATKSTKC